jgi:CheY-like chemotaxis protein
VDTKAKTLFTAGCLPFAFGNKKREASPMEQDPECTKIDAFVRDSARCLASVQPPPSAPLRILVVDDAVQLAAAVCELLEEIGYRTWSAGNGDEALHHLETRSFDLVLLDIMLPDTDGYTLCRHIRQWHGIPVVMMSGLLLAEHARHALTAGASVFVGKPFSLSELGNAIEEAFRQQTSGAPKPPAPGKEGVGKASAS